MTPTRLRSLQTLLMARAKLIKPVSYSRVIHDDTMRVTMDIVGYWEPPLSPTLKASSRILPDESITGENNSTAVCLLCYQVLEKLMDINAIYCRKDFIINKLCQFTIDEILWLCYTLTRHVTQYSTWFHVNCNDFNVLLMCCHRFLLESISHMTVEQLNSSLVIFDSLSPRYPIFGFTCTPLQQCIIRRATELCRDEGLLAEQRTTQRNDKIADSAVRQLPTLIQRIYRRIHPYFEAVNGKFRESRSNVCHLITAAAMIQRQAAKVDSFPVGQFNYICSTLKNLIRTPEVFSLDSLLRLIPLLHANTSISPDAVRLDIDEVHALTVKLKDLALDTYIVLPYSDGDVPLPVDVEQCVTKMLSTTLERPCLDSLSSCLAALEDKGLLNKHISMLFIPYILNKLRDGGNELDSVVALLLPTSVLGLYGFPFWVLYLSVLNNWMLDRKRHDIEGLIVLCDSLTHFLKLIIHEMLGGHNKFPDADEASLQQNSSKDGNRLPSSEMHYLVWLGNLNDILLVNATDMERLESASSLQTLIARRFHIEISSIGLSNNIITSINGLKSLVADVIKAKKSQVRASSTKWKEMPPDEPHNNLSDPPPCTMQSHDVSLDDRIVVLNRAFISLEVYIDTFVGLLKDTV